jgi:hypothetical protein
VAKILHHAQISERLHATGGDGANDVRWDLRRSYVYRGVDTLEDPSVIGARVRAEIEARLAADHILANSPLCPVELEPLPPSP